MRQSKGSIPGAPLLLTLAMLTSVWSFPTLAQPLAEAGTSATDDTASGAPAATTQFTLAKLAAADGRFEEARQLFEAAVAQQPEDPILRVEFAQFLFRFGRSGAAREEITEARRLAPEEPTVLRIFGQIHLADAGNDPEAGAAALEALETLRRSDPSDLMGMVTLAQVYENTGRPGRAADVIGELTAFHTDNTRLKRYRIELLRRAGRSAEAMEALRDVVRFEQESIESRLELAEREFQEGNFTAAIELLDQVREQRDTPEVTQRLAEALLGRSQAPGLSESQRSEDLARVRELRSDLPDARSDGLEARVLAVSGETPEAIEVLETSLENSVDIDNLVLLGRLRERIGRTDAAIDALDRAVEVAEEEELRLQLERERIAMLARNERWSGVEERITALVAGSDPEELSGLRALRLEALVETGQHEKALKILERDGGREPGPENLMARAEVLAASGQLRDARRMLRRIEDEDPSLAQRRAEVLIRMGDVEEAVEVVDGLVSDGGLDAFLAAGQFFTAEQLFGEAQRYLERALETETATADAERRADVAFLLGQALERQGRIEEAAERFRQVLSVREDDPLALNYLGYMLADADLHLEEAHRLIARAVEMDPGNGAYQDSLGWVQYRLGNYREAADALEKARRLSPRNPTILDHLGDVYRALSELEEARKAYEEALWLAEGEEAERVRRKLEALDASSGSD